VGDCACDVSVNQLDPATPISVVYLELTPTCNNACSGCSNVFAHDAGNAPLPTDVWARIFEKLAPHQPRLRLTGGEPTLHPEFDQIVRRVEATGFPFTVFTNARWPNPGQLIELLASASGLECLLISLHGANAASHEAFSGIAGSFQETTDNARKASAAGLSVTTSTVITRHNYSEVADIVALGHELGAGHAVFNRYIGAALPGLEASEDELRAAVQAVERQKAIRGNGWIKFGTPIPHCFEPNSSNGCMAGFAHVTIDPWGNVRPCPHTPIVAGNILQQSLDTILLDDGMVIWRQGYLAQCKSCRVAENCFAGCQAMTLARNEPYDPLIV